VAGNPPSQADGTGKDYRRLRATLEDPDMDEPKAFEAVDLLAVLVRILSEQKQHALVVPPPNSDILAAGRAFEATEMVPIRKIMTTMEDIIHAVSARHSHLPQVMQAVAIPTVVSVKTYDFFLLHKGGEG
jgi:hypothetical protein